MKVMLTGSEGYVGQFVIIFNFVQDFRPVFFDQRIVVHFLYLGALKKRCFQKKLIPDPFY